MLPGYDDWLNANIPEDRICSGEGECTGCITCKGYPDDEFTDFFNGLIAPPKSDDAIYAKKEFK